MATALEYPRGRAYHTLEPAIILVLALLLPLGVVGLVGSRLREVSHKSGVPPLELLAEVPLRFSVGLAAATAGMAASLAYMAATHMALGRPWRRTRLEVSEDGFCLTRRGQTKLWQWEEIRDVPFEFKAFRLRTRSGEDIRIPWLAMDRSHTMVRGRRRPVDLISLAYIARAYHDAAERQVDRPLEEPPVVECRHRPVPPALLRPLALGLAPMAAGIAVAAYCASGWAGATAAAIVFVVLPVAAGLYALRRRPVGKGLRAAPEGLTVHSPTDTRTVPWPLVQSVRLSSVSGRLTAQLPGERLRLPLTTVTHVNLSAFAQYLQSRKWLLTFSPAGLVIAACQYYTDPDKAGEAD